MKLLFVTCMLAANFQGTTAFDSNWKNIAIDNCSSRCLTVSRKDFLPGTLRKCNVFISGVGGTIKCRVKGTVAWTVEDDQGRAHDIIIPDTPPCARHSLTDYCLCSIGHRRRKEGVPLPSFVGSSQVASQTLLQLP
jgi:hypothetical protein